MWVESLIQFHWNCKIKARLYKLVEMSQCDWPTRQQLHLSIKARNLCLSVSMSVCQCVRVCSSNISADQDQTDLRVSTWLLLGSRVCQVGFVWTTMIPLINYFINALKIPQALSTGATTVTCAPEPISAEPTTYKKQADLDLQRRKLDRDFVAVRSRSVHLNWLLQINETKRVWTESVLVWGDPEVNKLESESVDVHV